MTKATRWAEHLATTTGALVEAVEELERLRRIYDAVGISADLEEIPYTGNIIGHLDEATILNGLYAIEQITNLLNDSGGAFRTNLYRLMP